MLDGQEGKFYVDGPFHLDDDGLIFAAVAAQDVPYSIDAAAVGIEDCSSSLDLLRIGNYFGQSEHGDTFKEYQHEVLPTSHEGDIPTYLGAWP